MECNERIAHISTPFDAAGRWTCVDVTVKVDVVASFDSFGVQGPPDGQTDVWQICTATTAAAPATTTTTKQKAKDPDNKLLTLCLFL